MKIILLSCVLLSAVCAKSTLNLSKNAGTLDGLTHENVCIANSFVIIIIIFDFNHEHNKLQEHTRKARYTVHKYPSQDDSATTQKTTPSADYNPLGDLILNAGNRHKRNSGSDYNPVDVILNNDATTKHPDNYNPVDVILNSNPDSSPHSRQKRHFYRRRFFGRGFGGGGGLVTYNLI